MDWFIALPVIIAFLIALFLTGLPVALAFMVVNFVGLYLSVGGVEGLFMPINSAFSILTSTVMLPVSSFILMGEIMFHTGAGSMIIDAVDKWIGRIPARLSLLIVASGTLFATLSGSSIATTAMLGTTLVPESSKRGYSPDMVLGPCLASGGLAILVPPTIMGVVVAAIAGISVGKFLISIVIPGLVLAALYAIYIVTRGVLHPDDAPSYEGKSIGFWEKIATLRLIAPTALIIFFVIGSMFLGIATASESGALGVLGMLAVCAIYGKLSWSSLKKALVSSTRSMVMICVIIAGSTSFSQLIAYTGAGGGMARWAAGLSVPPGALFLFMMLIILFFGFFMDGLSFSMITIPIFKPVLRAVGIDLNLFTVALLVGVEIGLITPPFGLNLLVMQGVAPQYKFSQIYRSAFPYIICGLILLALIYMIPGLTTWLPGLMR